MSSVMHLLHVLHTRDATCSALNTVCVKTELSAVVESHRDRLRLLWLVLRSEHYCVRTHTHARRFLSSHTKMIFSGRGGDVCRHPPTHLPSLMHWNLQHFCQVPHKCLYFTHPLTSSLCVPLALCSIHVLHTLTHNLVCVLFSSYRLFEINKICTAFQHRQLQNRLLGQRDGVDSVLTSANQIFTKANVCY